MLQKAIIEQKIDKYSMKVRIPVYNKIKSDPTATPTNELYTAIIQTLPGCSPNYLEGDVVLVDFENDNISYPVIIGLLFRENMSEGSTDITADSLKVNVNTDLSENTLIGSVTPEAIKKLNDKYANNVKSVLVEYSLSNYEDHYESFTQWSEQAPQYWPGKYMWQRTTVTYENDTATRSMTCIQGAKGDPGSSITITETYVKYAVSSSGTTHPSTSAQSTWYNNPPATTDPNPYLWSWTYVLYSDGTSTDTFNVSRTSPSSLIVYLYKRSNVTIPQIDWQTNLIYNFDTKQFTSLPTGWSSSIPSGNDPIYVTAATASSVESTCTITPAEWSSPILFTKSGFNSKTVQIYKRGTTVPSVPSSSVTYTFSDGSISPASPDGWSIAIPTTNGNPCYVTQATAISYEDTDTITTSEWSAPSILAQDGASDYIDQNVVDWYIATSTTTVPTTPSSDIEVSTEWTTLGWTDDISSIDFSSTDKYLWNAEVEHYSISGYIKTNPHIIAVYAESGVGISSITEYYALSTNTTRPSSGWSTNLPTMDAVNRYLWNYSVITYTDGSSSGTQTDALIIGVYGESTLSLEIESDNGTLFNSKTLSTTLSPSVYLGINQLTVNSNGTVVSGSTTIGQINWFARERFIGNGVAVTYDLGLDILNYSTTPSIEIKIDNVVTSAYTVVDENTITFTTAPADESIVIITYLTSDSRDLVINRTDVRNQVLITCKLVSGLSILGIAETTVKDLNDARSVQSWYMLTVDDVLAGTLPTVIYDPLDYTVTPSGEYQHEDSGSTITETFTWQDISPVVSPSTVNRICYSFQMIIFEDNSCSAGIVQRDTSYDSAVNNYLQAITATDAANQAQNSANAAQSTADNAMDGVHANAEDIQNVQQTLTAVNGVLAAKLDTVTFSPYQENIDAFMQFDVANSTMTLGQGNFKQQLSATKNSFLEGSTEVAYISNQELYINNATINQKLTLDEQWIITFDSNGLTVKHI